MALHKNISQIQNIGLHESMSIIDTLGEKVMNTVLHIVHMPEETLLARDKILLYIQSSLK